MRFLPILHLPALPLPIPLILVPVLTAACAEPGRIDLALRAPDGTGLDAVDTLEVTLLTEPDGTRVAEGQVQGGSLEELDTAFRRADVDPDRRYVFEVRGDTGICDSGRVVGRSLPFEVESNDSVESVTMYVACADEFAPTESRMQAERSSFAAVWDATTPGAVLLGGASRVVLVADGSPTELVPLDSVERYDVATGEFSSDPPLTMPRAAPVAQIVGDGTIAVLGGVGLPEVDGSPGAPLDTVEALEGETRRGLVNLANYWVETSSLVLNDGTIALVGSAYDVAGSLSQAEVYDAVRSLDVASVPSLFGAAQRSGAMVVAFDGRDRALMAGGIVGSDAGVAPPPELFDASSACDDGATDPPCMGLIDEDGDPDGFGPGAGWKSAAGAWAPCAAGGGTAYLMGGEIGAEPAEQVAEIFCFRDEPGSAPAPLRRIGELRSARAGASAVLVRGSRILVVGGAARSGGVGNAELFRVDACTCEQQIETDAIEEIPIDLDSNYLLRPTLVPLGDGTVLVAGAVALQFGPTSVELSATNDAWVFDPDLD
ncbi:MAG: hypothetical protein HYY06_15795 [Deltaproteobacteria bacterium]|nr:hypothetical protein [Deltaproteobacteria bacterium]